MCGEGAAGRGFWRRKFVEFCNRTDLHGFKYIVMESLTSLERGCWAAAVLLSTVFAAYFVAAAYTWYARNPIVTVIESTQGAIWDIPFPAVTICDVNAVSKRRARELADQVKLVPNVTSEDVFEALRLTAALHSPYVTSAAHKRQLRALQDVMDLNKISVPELFRLVSPARSCSDLLQRCMWKNTVYRCEQLFRQILTMYKLCCAFNYYAVDLDLYKYQQQEQLVRHTEPRRVASCGYQTALTVLLSTRADDYYSALVPTQGAMVFIDSAYNIPNQDSPTRLVNPSSEVLVALSPERTYTTPGIRAFTPDQRDCFYSDEVKIGEFRRYSLHNCIAYQRVQVIKKLCDCIPFFFPVRNPPRICSFHDLECLESALNPREESMVSADGATRACLPECEHYDYPLEVAMGKMAADMQLTGLHFFNNMEVRNQSLLNVFFNDLVSTRFRRDVYFNWQNFTAAFGGLLSLMLGFTLIAAFDLILFFTVRLCYDPAARAPPPARARRSWAEQSARRQYPGARNQTVPFKY